MVDKKIIETLRQEQKRLENIMYRAENRLSIAPEGSVLVKRYKKGVQFYCRKDSKDRNGVYMPTADRDRAVALVQKSYDRKVLAAARDQWKVLDSFLTEFDPDALRNVYEKESELRKILLNPCELPDRQYAEVWEAVKYEKKGFSEDAPVQITNREERVRSKSEAMIANVLLKEKIPYRYECPLKMRSQIIHPDFTILRLRDRKVMYWEHLGMMDDAEYRNAAFQRIRMYETNGIFPGDQLILTFETLRMPLNAGIVQRMARHYAK